MEVDLTGVQGWEYGPVLMPSDLSIIGSLASYPHLSLSLVDRDLAFSDSPLTVHSPAC